MPKVINILIIYQHENAFCLESRKTIDLLPSDHISVGGKYNVRESLLLSCMISCDARLSRLDEFIVFARYAC